MVLPAGMALHNKVVETWKIYMTFIGQKLGTLIMSILENFFVWQQDYKSSPISGGSFDEYLEQYCNIIFPAQTTSLGLMYFVDSHLPVIDPVAHAPRRLDLVDESLNC